MIRLRDFTCIRTPTSALLLCTLLVQVCAPVLMHLALWWPNVAEAAVVTIDATASNQTNAFNTTGSSVVFVDDQIGYVFYRDSANNCVYSKTTNGGTTWNSAVVVDGQTDCIKIVVWYDRWTPGDKGNFIHIITADTSEDDLFYNRLDTTTDTRLNGTTPTNISNNSGQASVLSDAANLPAVTKATNGTIYASMNDDNDSYVVSCSSSCNLTTSWTEVGTSPFDAGQNDLSLLAPLAGGQVMLINRDISADDVRYRTWTGSLWTGWSDIDINAPENSDYDGGFTVAVDRITGDLYLAYAADNNSGGGFTTADHDIRTAYYNGTSWTNTADVFTNIAGRGLHNVSIGFDQNTGDVYVVYILRDTIATATTGQVYWRSSTNGMSSWSAEQGPLNTVAQNLYGINVNPQSYDRLYAMWYDPNLDDVLGNTVADIAPETTLRTLGTQLTEVRSDQTAVYLGGSFVLETSVAKNVTGLTFTELGTINGETGLNNIRVVYDLDTSAPYDCVSESYDGTETQFGITDANGFSGADGVSSFSGSIVPISATQSMCIYIEVDVLSAAADGSTIDITVVDPSADVVVSGGTPVYPYFPLAIAGVTTVRSPNLTLGHYHWRNDDGTEAGATSATGGVEDVPLTALQKLSPRRLRFGISNEGSTTTLPTTFQLEYGVAAPTCDAVTAWIDVDEASDAIDLFDSTFITDGTDTTNISILTGGVTDEGASFLTPNGGLRDTRSTTSPLTIDTTQFVELEWSIVAAAPAVEGETYCFRVSDDGNPLTTYQVFPSATIQADVRVQSFGTSIAQADIPVDNQYFGGGFAIRENSSSRTVSNITLAEQGTIDASVGLTNLKLFYDLDTTAPYDCADQAYTGSELQFGPTDTDGMSAANGTSTFSGSVLISTVQTMCVYVVADVTVRAQNSETVSFLISSPGTDVTVSGGGSVAPTTPIAISASTTLRGGILTQTHYHWRNDDGDEASATSATGGVEDTPITEVAQESPLRLRLSVSNEGATTSVPTRYSLEYGPKITTCDAVSVWTAVDDPAGSFVPRDSTFLTHGANTTNIAEATGGVTDENSVFKTPNGGVRDTEALTASTTLTETEFIELEYSFSSTVDAAFNTTYCFRVSNNGTPLPVYSVYPEITTAPKRDFRVQRGSTVVTGAATTITAGVDYVAPSSVDSAFIRITNSHHTGAGRTSLGGNQAPDDTSVYISNPQNLLTSVTFTRPAGASNDTRIDWEIVEFIGEPGTDNEVIVRSTNVIAIPTPTLTATGSAVTVTDDTDVVVFITGVRNPNTSSNYYAGQVTASWDPATNQPVFRRGAAGGASIDVSYAIVEYVGINWQVQRVEHRYTLSGTVQTQPITPVNSLERTFIHAQKRMGGGSNLVRDYGHTVWLSSIGAVSFLLESSASVAFEQTSVAWVIENLQTAQGAMNVQRRGGTTINGTEPLALSITLDNALSATNNSSIFFNSSAAGTSQHPRAIAGALITSPTTFQIWRSDTGSQLTYRYEVVEWPVADLVFRQNYYRFYVDNNLLTPSDPWPPGPNDLGENTSITSADEPLGEGQVVRVRLSLQTSNANTPPGLSAFRLQYGLRSTTCSAVSTWTNVGNATSSEIWRGFSATGTSDGLALSVDPPTPGDLLLSVSDVAGRLVHNNPSVANPYTINEGDDIEFDWYIQQNGAIPSSVYCFRVVLVDDSPLAGYFNYPQIRTAGFSPVSMNWRWYSDPLNETPLADLAPENTAPINIASNDTLALRLTVDERKNVEGVGARFAIQFSDDSSFTNPQTVVATSTCVENSLWCFFDGGGDDNALITTSLLSDSDGCVGGTGNGCGTHHESSTYITGHNHGAGRAQEYSFTVTQRGARVNAVYYFRLYDLLNNEVVPLDTSASYPSVVIEGSNLTLSVSGLPSNTVVSGVTTDATTTPTAINFGNLLFNTEYAAAQQLTISTNATEGYQVLKYARQQLNNSYGDPIPPTTGTNLSPVGWLAGCALTAIGCFGYHTTDATLRGGSARFAPIDSYAGLDTEPAEIIYSSIPVTNDSHTVLYRLSISELQPAGMYETSIVYIALPVF